MEWKEIIKTAAPVLATALGSPLAGAATKFLAEKFLGDSDATEEDLAKALQESSPEMVSKLKEIDNQFKLEMRKMDLQGYEIEVDDRKSARQRATDLAKAGITDYTTEILAITIIAGYFALNYLFAASLDHESKTVLQSIRDLAMVVVSYYFGSSRGERNINNK